MINCYCSAGRGMGTFVSKELENFHCVDKISVTDGKVYFSIQTDSLYYLMNLKSAERGFLSILQIKTQDVTKGPELDVNKLGSYILKKEQWLEGLEHYGKLQNRLKENKNSPGTEEKLNQNLSECRAVSFRICCKCSGRISRYWNPQRLSCWLGRKLSRLLGWRVEIRRPQLEIAVHLNDSDVVVGIPITREPLSRREYIRHPGLRSTVAWTLCYLLDIQSGDIVLDPLCGKATILIEGAHNWRDAVYIGMDHSPSQMKFSSENVRHAGSASISLVQSDINDLPLSDGSVDRVVCDLPFGQIHKVKENMKGFYYRALVQIDRVLKSGGRVVLLTSCEMERDLLDNIEINADGKQQTSSETGPVADTIHDNSSDNKILTKERELDLWEHRNIDKLKVDEGVKDRNTETVNESEIVRASLFCSVNEAHKRKMIHPSSGAISEPLSKSLKVSACDSCVVNKVCSISGQDSSDPQNGNDHKDLLQADDGNEPKTTPESASHDLKCNEITPGNKIDLELSGCLTSGSDDARLSCSETRHFPEDKVDHGTSKSLSVGKLPTNRSRSADNTTETVEPQKNCCVTQPLEQQYDGSTNLSIETALKCPGSQYQDMDSSNSQKIPWKIGPNYYIKLGETHAKICTFQKK